MYEFGIIFLFFIEIIYKVIKIPTLLFEHVNTIIETTYKYIGTILNEINKTGEFTFSFKITRTIHNTEQAQQLHIPPHIE